MPSASPAAARRHASSRRSAAAPPSRAKTSLADDAYETIKWQILKMQIKPGTFLNVQELADRLDIGRSPVHVAVTRLHHDGLLEVLPRKGIVVRSWSRGDIAQELEARRPLEVEIARLAAERADREAIANLKAVLAKGPGLIRAGDRGGLMELDRTLHHALAAVTGNPTMVELQELLHQRSTPLWFITIAERREYQRVQGEHERIVAAVAARDPEKAAQAMHTHLAAFVHE